VIPGVTEFAFGRLLSPELATEPLVLTDDGHLLVAVAGETMTRTDSMLLCTENLEIRPLNRRMQGRAVPEVFRRLVVTEGDGYLLLARENETFHILRLERDLCFFVENYLWALDSTLMWDVGVLPGTRASDPIALVRAAGEGLLALRVPGQLVAIKVAQDKPYRVHESGLVGWVGNVIPQREPDVPFLHCEGEGAVFVMLPGPNSQGSTSQ
jgi:uncharacterized protein (AIM24 family)